MSDAQRTLIIVKPDGVQRGLVGTIIQRLEQKGLRLAALKLMSIDRDLARRHYAEHQGKPFYPGLVDFITSGPVVAGVAEGPDAIEATRKIMGITNPVAADPGSVRGMFALTIGRNLIHGSEHEEAARREVALFFKESELLSYRRDIDNWIVE
jgi:nucleoside-diphosphate kinase